YGEARIELQSPPTKDVSLSMEFGDMRLNLPSNSAFSLEARTSFGNVHSEFGNLSSDQSTSNQERSVIGRVGEGGPRIHLETRFGDIRLQKRGYLCSVLNVRIQLKNTHAFAVSAGTRWRRPQ